MLMRLAGWHQMYLASELPPCLRAVEDGKTLKELFNMKTTLAKASLLFSDLRDDCTLLSEATT